MKQNKTRNVTVGTEKKSTATISRTWLSGKVLSFEVVELGGGTMNRSVDLIRVHALRAADGIQLACALIAAGSPGASSEFVFVSSDQELNAAAEMEGMTILDPRRE